MSLPTNSRVLIGALLPGRSRCMKSAQMPLWLEFSNADLRAKSTVPVIFKAGDDLRQDSLTLHTIAIMDKLWKSEGLDMCMSTYRCIPTGNAVGLIEVVTDSKTVGKIQKEEAGLTGALRSTSIRAWLEKCNPDKADLDMATTSFVLSCAGYVVATFILGVGDRHNDNIMVDTSGHFFHIDFAYFLGRIVRFGPYDREKAPFVLTNEFVQAMGGAGSPNFALFVRTCCRAYNILRRNAHTFYNVFKLMLSTGMAQLSGEDDLKYLRSAFRLDLSEDEAARFFVGLIEQSLNCKTTLVNFMTHTLVHWND